MWFWLKRVFLGTRPSTKRSGPRFSLDDLIDAITDENRHAEVDWGPPRGNEVW